MAFDWDVALDGMYDWVVGGTGLSADKVMWGGQDTARPDAPAVTMRISNISELGSTWLDYENNPHTFADITVNASAASNEFTAVAHARLTGDGPVRLTSTGTFPGGTDGVTDYWVVKITNDTFKLAASFQDAMATIPVFIDLTSDGTGTIKLVDTESTLRQGEELRAVSRGLVRATLELTCHSDPVVSMNTAIAILQKIRTRRELPSQQDILETANIALQDVERVRAIITGRRDDFLFEPRAMLDVHLCFAVEESELMTIIERVEVTNTIPDPDVMFVVP